MLQQDIVFINDTELAENTAVDYIERNENARRIRFGAMLQEFHISDQKHESKARAKQERSMGRQEDIGAT